MRMHKNILGGGHLLGTSGALLALLLGVMLFPAIPDAAQAEGVGTKATLVVHPMLSVELQSAVNCVVMPSQSGAFSACAATLSVSTNNETGYSLYLSTVNGKSTLASLNPSVANTIGAVSGTVEESGFGDNTWGYNLSEGTPSDNLTYQAVPGDSTVQQGFGSEGPTASDTYTLTFGTKVNTSLPSGTYSNQVVVSVVANPGYVVDYFNGISTMQEMTTEVCQTAAANETARLRDTRDGKLYWVAKLADGNCWMTQNLDFDIPADGLNNTNGLAAKTDLLDGTVWDSASGANAPQPTNTTIENVYNSSNYYSTYSFDPGMYVNNDPTAWAYCSNYWNGGSCDNWTNVSNMSPMTEIRDESTNIVDTNNNTYDAHYLAGNYYQFTAATAGTGASVTTNGDNAAGSICPKGWRLPSSGDSNDTNDFYALTTGNSITTGSTLSKAPYYFIPAGYVDFDFLNSAGNNGYYCSSTARSSTYAYFLYFGPGYVYPSRNVLRYVGFSVRCLAR